MKIGKTTDPEAGPSPSCQLLDSLPLIRVRRLLIVSYYPHFEILAVRIPSESLSLTADE